MTTMRALVTGGTSGIGAAICRRLAADGWQIAVAGRSQERADALAAEISGVAIVGDVANPADDTVARAAAALGGLDAALLNAGVILDADLSSTPDADWDLLMGVNVFAVHRQARAALPYLQASKGSLLITASDAGLWGEAPIAAYSIAKRMALTMTRCLAAEWGPAGVRVNAICPGDTAPGMLTTTTGRRTPGATDGWLAPPLGTIVRGEDVAAAAAFLVSADASRITGTGLLIDAGMRSSTTAWQAHRGSDR
ncbi:MAG: SDR family oxidoreductase [Thermoleophilia bacterium]|nr:SDR family oxidoreductase [Thermoleophilia bacterium]